MMSIKRPIEVVQRNFSPLLEGILVYKIRPTPAAIDSQWIKDNWRDFETANMGAVFSSHLKNSDFLTRLGFKTTTRNNNVANLN